ncbi:MAG TPA: hypothetical protein VJP76_02925 [Candidatus Tumulicola sp.]|nr:hypothetical protein [Candidatus Tumulicola sp.]
MKRTELASITMIGRDDIMLIPLMKAGIVANELQRGSRENVVVSLNAGFPVYNELRAPSRSRR